MRTKTPGSTEGEGEDLISYVISRRESIPGVNLFSIILFRLIVIFNGGNLAVLVQKMVQRKLEIGQSILLPWIIKMG